MTTDAGGLLLRETDRRLNLLARLAKCFADRRNPNLIRHSVREMVAQRVYALAFGYVTPQAYTPDDPVLEVTMAILAGGKATRLYRALVVEAKLASDVDAALDSNQLASSAQVSATVASGKKVEDVERALDTVLEGLAKQGPTRGELERAKRRILLNVLGARVRVVAPSTLLPPGIENFGVEVCRDMRDGLRNADIVMMLRLQRERMHGSLVPSSQEYFAYFGLDERKLAYAKADALVMHPGPMNRGVEIDSSVADGAQSLIREQVEMGVAVRMAVLEALSRNFPNA